jgi:hypothetical protein
MAVIITCRQCGKLHRGPARMAEDARCPFCGASVAGAPAADTRDAKRAGWESAYLLGEFRSGLAIGGTVAVVITVLFRSLPILALLVMRFSARVRNDPQLQAQTNDLLLHELVYSVTAIMVGMVAGAAIVAVWALIHRRRPNRQPPIRQAVFAGALLGPLGVIVSLSLPLFINHGPDKLALVLIWHWLACLIAAPVGAILVSAMAAWYWSR